MVLLDGVEDHTADAAGVTAAQPCALRGIQTPRELLQEACSGCVPSVFLALVVLLGHQRVVEPGPAQAAVLPRLSSAVCADHRHGPRQGGGRRGARGGVCGNRGGRGGILLFSGDRLCICGRRAGHGWGYVGGLPQHQADSLGVGFALVVGLGHNGGGEEHVTQGATLVPVHLCLCTIWVVWSQSLGRWSSIFRMKHVEQAYLVGMFLTLIVSGALGLGDELGIADVTIALCEQASIHDARRLHLHLRLAQRQRLLSTTPTTIRQTGR